jgi:hypothetical protein
MAGFRFQKQNFRCLTPETRNLKPIKEAMLKNYYETTLVKVNQKKV